MYRNLTVPLAVNVTDRNKFTQRHNSVGGKFLVNLDKPAFAVDKTSYYNTFMRQRLSMSAK